MGEKKKKKWVFTEKKTKKPSPKSFKLLPKKNHPKMEIKYCENCSASVKNLHILLFFFKKN
jgi:hypothetical protein